MVGSDPKYREIECSPPTVFISIRFWAFRFGSPETAIASFHFLLGPRLYKISQCTWAECYQIVASGTEFGLSSSGQAVTMIEP